MINVISGDAAAQVQAERLLRGAWSWQKYKEGLAEASLKERGT